MAQTFSSVFAQPVTMQNFCPTSSAQLAVSNAGSTGSASITFTPDISTNRSTFKISNTGTKTAYIAWGVGSATAVVSTSTPAVNCDAVPGGSILTQDFISNSGKGTVNTIAAICAGSDTTVLEITQGSGQ